MPASLYARFALPDDPDLDSFVSGVREVDDYFRSRQWFNVGKGIAAPPTYQFLTHEQGEVIGYAAVAFKNTEHPHDNSGSRARYLVVYVVGVHERFKGMKNPKAQGDTYAASLFQVLEEIGRTEVLCVGLSLWVRADNARAIAFYKKVGFESDPGGPVPRDSGLHILRCESPSFDHLPRAGVGADSRFRHELPE